MEVGTSQKNVENTFENSKQFVPLQTMSWSHFFYSVNSSFSENCRSCKTLNMKLIQILPGKSLWLNFILAHRERFPELSAQFLYIKLRFETEKLNIINRV